jgi:hypothetical protein
MYPEKTAMRKRIIVRSFLLPACVILLAGICRGGDVIPPDAGAVNVREDPYNARGDGVTDDTAALQKAMAQNGFIYIPNGVYLVSATLRVDAGLIEGAMIQGESATGTVIRLADKLPQFGDPKHRREVILMADEHVQAFRNHIRDLTIDTGSKNAAAVGLAFCTANEGSVLNVLIRSGDGRGLIGLDLGYAQERGPCFVKNVEVAGFDVGIECSSYVSATTLENVFVRGQGRCGIRNSSHSIAGRGIRSRNRVPAFENRGDAAVAVLIDSELSRGESVANGAAVINEGGMFVRNLKSSGYRMAVVNKAGTKTGCVGPDAEEWVSHDVLGLSGAARRSLDLPVKDAPSVEPCDTNDWISVKQFEPRQKTMRIGAKEQDVPDWSDCIQQAIDSGKSTVYFPRGNYVVDGAIHLRGKVKRLIGMDSAFGLRGSDGTGRATFIIDDGDELVVRLERFNWMNSNVDIRHASGRTLVVCCVDGGRYTGNVGTSEVFFEDVSMDSMVFRKGQNAWGRQCNVRSRTEPKIVNDGANLWILGMSADGFSSLVVSKSGASTELAGGLAYSTDERLPDAMFINLNGSSFSCSIGEWVLRNSPRIELVVEEKDGKHRILTHEQVPMRGTKGPGAANGAGISAMLPLYTGYAGQ